LIFTLLVKQLRQNIRELKAIQWLSQWIWKTWQLQYMTVVILEEVVHFHS